MQYSCKYVLLLQGRLCQDEKRMHSMKIAKAIFKKGFEETVDL